MRATARPTSSSGCWSAWPDARSGALAAGYRARVIRRRRHEVVVIQLDGDIGAPQTADLAGAPKAGAGLVVGRPDDDLGPGHDEATSGPSREARAPRWGQAAVAGGLVVVALVTWGVTAAVHEHRRVARLLDAPGGVLSLAHAPSTRWSAATDSADATAFMPGLVVVRRGTELHGLDAVTGADRWQVEVGGDPTCASWAWAPGAPAVVDPLVCWSGPATGTSTVTVVHADGSSSTRVLDAHVDAVAGTVGGGLVTARRIGPAPPTPGVALTLMDGGGYTISGSLPRGQDAVVRLEDAATGAVRWERTVPFRPVADINSCSSLNVVDGKDGPTVDLTSLSLSTYPSLIQLHGCGLEAGFTPSGDLTTSPDAGPFPWAVPYVDGGLLEQVDSPGGIATVLRGPDGTVAGPFPQQVLQPRATDGTTSDLVLAGTFGVPLHAFARDGTLRWQNPRAYLDLLVRTAGVIVAQREDLAISGLDPATGAALWTDTDLLTGTSTASAQDFVLAAFTDGSVAVIALAHSDGTPTALVALDLATGAVLWRSTVNGSWPQLVAVQGRLVEVVGGQGSQLGDDGHGGTIRRTPGTVTLLG